MKSFKDYILCERQKEIANKLFEAKYSNFTNAELNAFKDELEYLKTNHNFLNRIIYSRADFSNNDWYKTHVVPKSDDIQYGNRYLLVFENPFTNPAQLTCEYDEKVNSRDHKPCETNEDKIIYCIAIADKFNKLHIVNQWGNDCTVQYREKGLYLKTDRFKFYSEPGWYLYRKGYASYYVNQEIHRSSVNNWWIVYPEKQQNTFVRLQNCVILDISKIPARFEKIQKEIEENAKLREREAKESEEMEKQKEELKKWWKEREDYKNLGYANGWEDVPEIIKIANKDPEAKWYGAKIGSHLTQYFCDKYKITYKVDSSD